MISDDTIKEVQEVAWWQQEEIEAKKLKDSNYEKDEIVFEEPCNSCTGKLFDFFQIAVLIVNLKPLNKRKIDDLKQF